ncbi:hypothetical protein F2P56_000983, partial [Juglans regia]
GCTLCTPYVAVLFVIFFFFLNLKIKTFVFTLLFSSSPIHSTLLQAKKFLPCLHRVVALPTATDDAASLSNPPPAHPLIAQFEKTHVDQVYTTEALHIGSRAPIMQVQWRGLHLLDQDNDLRN